MIVERTIQHRSLRAECSEAYSNMAANVLDVFEHLARSGTPLAPGIEIRFGWSLLHLIEDGSALRVTEPDFPRWPEQHWSPTLEITLGVLAAQTRLLHRLDAAGEDASFDQVLLAAPGALAQREIFVRRTSSMSAQDSGWLLGTLNDPEALTRADDLEAVSIASLVARRPAVLQALVLPLDFIALFAGDTLEQVFDAAGRARLP